MTPATDLYHKRMLRRRFRVGFAGGVCLLLASCGVIVERDAPGHKLDVDEIADAVPRDEPRSRYGNPDSYTVLGKRYRTLKSSLGFEERGIASWYGKKFHGHKTSSGEIYDMYKMTAAHKHLPLPTYVKVTNLENGRDAILRVNDRGPFHDNRVIDLSYAAALKLGMVEKGTAFVQLSTVNNASIRLVSAARAKPPTDGHLSLYLQIGAFNERGNAQRLSEHVARYLPENIRIHEGNSSDSSVYRVQVGPIASVDLADRLVDSLFSLGINDHHFVSN